MSNHNVQPIEKWYATSLAGDAVLCDPFSGQPLVGAHIGNEPKNPPEAFMQTDGGHLSNGYGFWKGSKYHQTPPLVGVYLTNPSSPNGLGDYAEFMDMASNFDVVVHSPAQTPRMEHMRRVSSGLGNMVMHNGVWVDRTYLAALSESHGLVVDLSDPQIAPESARLVQGVRDTVVTSIMDEQDPSDPSLVYGMADYTYANVSQWHQTMAAGLVGDGYESEYGRPMSSMLIVSSHENGDLGRKLVNSGVDMDRIDIAFATDALANDAMSQEYAHVLDRGYVGHEYLDGAEY